MFNAINGNRSKAVAYVCRVYLLPSLPWHVTRRNRKRIAPRDVLARQNDGIVCDAASWLCLKRSSPVEVEEYDVAGAIKGWMRAAASLSVVTRFNLSVATASDYFAGEYLNDLPSVSGVPPE